MPIPPISIKPSVRHCVVDSDFAAVLEEHFGIPTAFILRALKGESHQSALALCRLATSFEKPNGTLLMLARKFGRGRPRRRRMPCPPPRGHGQTSPWPCVDRTGPGRACGRPQQDGCSLWGVCDPDALDQIASRPGV